MNNLYTPELADRFLELLSSGLSLKEIRKMVDMPNKLVIRRWRREMPEFEKQYQLARKCSAEEFEDEILSTARELKDKDDVPVARAKFDLLRWIAGKRDSHYGNFGQSGDREPIQVNGGIPADLLGMDPE
jgi:DNA-binding transcriptional MerR regulator